VAAGVLGDPSEADDVLQEAAVIALEKLGDFEKGTSYSAWMASIVRHVARNHARKRARRATSPVAPEVLGELVGEDGAHEGRGRDPGRWPVDGRGRLDPDQTDFDDRLTAGLASLSPEPRAALLLRTLQGLGYREIAAILGMPEGTAMSHVHRARSALRQRLGAPAGAVELEERGA
jgi:RNA polymerase sigma-70 factor (ECF subfamily)